MNKIAWLRLTAILLLCAVLGTGCLDRLPLQKLEQTKTQTQEPKLRVLYATNEAGAEAIIAAAQAYTELTGVQIEVDALPYNNLQEKVFSELAQKSGYYDLMAVDTPWMPKIFRHLEPLSSYIANTEHPEYIELDDFIAKVFLDTSVYKLGYPEQEPPRLDTVDLKEITSAGFDIWSLPVQSNILTVSYRKDLFQNLEYQKEFKERYHRELTAPHTFDEYLELAGFFTRDTDHDGKIDLYGTTLMGSKHEANFDDFKSFLSSFGGRLFNDKLEPAFQNAAGIKALETYGSWIHEYKVTPPDVLSYTWDEVPIRFEFGQVAMSMNYHNMRLNPQVGGEVGYFMFPGSIIDNKLVQGPHFGSWGIAVNKYSARKEEAYKVAEYLTSPQAQLDYLQFNQHVTRTSAYEYSGFLQDPGLREYYRVLGNSLNVGVGRPRITNYDQVSEAVQTAVQDYLAGRKTAEAALSDAAVSVKALMRQAGYNEN